MADKAASGSPRRALGAVLEDILTEIGQGRGPENRPTKDDLIEYVDSGPRRLNLYLLRHLSAEQVLLLRRSGEFQERMQQALRATVIDLKPPLLIPQRVRSLADEAVSSPLAEVRRDPDLRAARLLSNLPLKVDTPPLLTLRDIQERLRGSLEARIPEVRTLDSLDRVFGFIERELDHAPNPAVFVRRALELSNGIRDVGEVTAFHRLMLARVLPLLRKLPPSDEKDRALRMLRDQVGTVEPDELAVELRRRTMAVADRLMKETKRYEDLVELRFFFEQTGERANKKLLSRKTGEIVRELDFRTQGHRLLTSLNAAELDDDSLIEVVPVVMAKVEEFVLGAPLRGLDLLVRFYLGTTVPLLRRMKNQPEKVPRLIQNFKRRVGLLNIYRDLDHLAQVIQRKMVLAVCGPRMLSEAPERIMTYLTRFPPEFFPEEVMKAFRRMIREHGTEYRFTPADVLTLLAYYPPPESEEETAPVKARTETRTEQ